MKKAKITVAFMGAGTGVGCTHTAVSVAYYTSDILKAKTALVEIGNNPALSALSENALDTFEGLNAFIRDGIYVFPDCPVRTLPRIINSEFEYVVLDITDNENESVEEYMRADLKFVVCSLCEWRKKDFEKTVKVLKDNHYSDNCLKIVTSTIGDNLEKDIKNREKIKKYVIPFIADPFYPDKAHMKFFKEFLSIT